MNPTRPRRTPGPASPSPRPTPALPLGTLVRDRSARMTGVVVPTLVDGEHEPWRDAMVSVMRLDLVTGVAGAVVTSSASGVATQYEVLPPTAATGPLTPADTVVILADLEGITGVPNRWDAVTPPEAIGGFCSPAYRAACEAMARDVQMALAGARAAGARRILVADAHWNDTNLADEDLDVELLRGSQAALRAMAGAAAVMMVGWHARAGAPNACLAHTYTERIRRLRIDGQEVGEIGMLRRLAVGQGSRVVLVSGDRAACEEVPVDDRPGRPTLTVVTKAVDPSGQVMHREPLTVWRELVGGAYRTVRERLGAGARTAGPDQPDPWSPVDPLRAAAPSSSTFEITLHPHVKDVQVLDVPGVSPGTPAAGTPVGEDASSAVVERVDDRTHRIRTASILATYTAFQRWVERLP